MDTAPNGAPLAFIADEKIPEIRQILEREGAHVAVALFDELTGPDTLKEGDYELWEVMAGVRHLLYKEGFAKGPLKVNDLAAHRLRRHNDQARGLKMHQIEEGFKEDLLVYRTAIALRAFANIEARGSTSDAEGMHDDPEMDEALGGRPDETESKSQERMLGMLRARFLKRRPNREAKRYFRQTEKGPRLNEVIDEECPLNELLNLLAWFEANSDQVEEHDSLKVYKEMVLEALIRRLVTSNDSFNLKASPFLTLRYFEAIIEQMPDTLSEGRIGGKSSGVLLAYAALEKETPDFDREFLAARPEFMEEDISLEGHRFEENTSTFIGTDVFREIVSYKKNAGLAEASAIKGYYRLGIPVDEEEHEKLDEAMDNAKLPPHIERQFRLQFKKLHGKPIIVRSSSELEDRLGASFAGRYESIELANSGDFEQDYQAFIKAILRVYKSAFSRDVMEYRKAFDLLGHNEQMGILIQELNGAEHGQFFYPDLSVVSMSYATQSIGFDPERGAARVACGLGGGVVDKNQGRYLQFAKPSYMYKQTDKCGRFIPPQTGVQVMRLADGEKVMIGATTLLTGKAGQGYRDCSLGVSKCGGSNGGQIVMDFQNLVENQASLIRRIEYVTHKLKHQLGYEVDCEFTAHWNQAKKHWTLKLVQCRPQNIPENLEPSRRPAEVEESHQVLEFEGAINGTKFANIKKVIYIDPEIFEAIDGRTRGRWLASYVGAINARMNPGECLMIAPGDIGTSDAEGHGLAVNFAQISNLGGVMSVGGHPISFGMHFGQILADKSIAVSNCPEKIFNSTFFREADHALAEDMPAIEDILSGPDQETAQKFAKYIKVIDVDQAARKGGKSGNRPMVLHLAQDPLVGKGIGDDRPVSLYLAEEKTREPIAVKELAAAAA